MSSAIILFSCQPPLHKVIPARSGEVDLADAKCSSPFPLQVLQTDSAGSSLLICLISAATIKLMPSRFAMLAQIRKIQGLLRSP